jgi:class 3 adenylate cyclase
LGKERSRAISPLPHPEELVRVRIGLHTGEAIKEADDFYGKNVVLAARIAARARGGQILVSEVVRSAVGLVARVRHLL